MKAALRASDAAQIEAPPKVDNPVYERRMVESQIRRPSIKIGAVIEFPGLRRRISIAGRERSIRVGLPGYRVFHHGRDADKAVRRARYGQRARAQPNLYFADQIRIEGVIHGSGPGVKRLHREAAGHAPAKAEGDAVVSPLVPRAIAENRPRAGARLEFTRMTRQTRLESEIR